MTLLTWLFLACSTGSAPAPAAPPPKPPPEAPVTHSDAAVQTPSAEAHPGEILYLDPDGSERVKAAADVPESIAWVKVGGWWEPVVKVEAIAVDGKVRTIVRYGVDNQVLERVTPRPPPRR